MGAEREPLEKVPCRTPAEGRDGVTNIPKWKFDAVAAAIRTALMNETDLSFKELQAQTRAAMKAADIADLGSFGWHFTVVKLELEVRGDIVRAPGGGPQKLRLA
ncbi:MAG: hypothetical protein AAGJ87_09010 [Pseudomonadota bacterium]